MKIYEFDAVIIKHEDMDAAYIEFPYDVEEEFGTKGQVKVKATFDGYEYRGSLAKFKEGHKMRICILMGSPKKKGNTATFIRPFIEELSRLNSEVDCITLYDSIL